MNAPDCPLPAIFQSTPNALAAREGKHLVAVTRFWVVNDTTVWLLWTGRGAVGFLRTVASHFGSHSYTATHRRRRQIIAFFDLGTSSKIFTGAAAGHFHTFRHGFLPLFFVVPVSWHSYIK